MTVGITDLTFISAFTIRELTGDKRLLRLSGRALPYRPYELSGSQRNDLSWYPGSPIGVMQILGAREEPTTINGWWKERFIAESATADSLNNPFAQLDGEPISTVRRLAELVDDIRRKGQIIEVTWLDLARHGILERFTQRWHNALDLEYEIAFSWISQAEDLAPLVLVGEQDLSELPNLMQSVVDGLNQPSFFGEVGGAIGDITDTINASIFELESSVVALEDAVVANIQLTLGPLETAARAASVLDFMKRQARNLANTIVDEAEGAWSNFENDTYTYGTFLSGQLRLRGQKQGARNVQRTAAVEQDTIGRRVSPDLIQTVVSREGQDLREISTENYGTPDEWRSLMHFNGLGNSRLSAGQLVFVPRNPVQFSCR